MGVDSFTIHTDGVIERGQDLESVLLNILEVGSHKMSVLSAYKAQRKCFKLAKKSRSEDYKEYVERLQLDHYPGEFKKSELGKRLSLYLWAVPFFFAATCLFFILGVDWAFDGSDAAWCVPIFITNLLLTGLCIWRIIIHIKRIRGNSTL